MLSSQSSWRARQQDTTLNDYYARQVCSAHHFECLPDSDLLVNSSDIAFELKTFSTKYLRMGTN